MPTAPSRRPTTILLASLTGVLTLALALLLGPHPPAVATSRHGDPDLSARLAEQARPGHHHLAAFTIVAGVTTFAGLGADAHTEVEIGSVTKTFTAEILRNQIDADRVTLDTEVGEIIDAGDSPVADVTLGELAGHTSGLPRLGGISLLPMIFSNFTAGNPYRGVSREDVLDAALAAGTGGRGEEEYSNLGFAFLGQLLAIEAGTSYADLLQTQILDPLGMTDTYLMSDGSVPADAPRGRTLSGRTAQPWEMGAYNPAGGIRSTPADMARYAEHLLAVGVPDFTWVREDTGYFWHNGGTSYSTMLIIDPAEEQAAFVSGDTATGVEAVAAALLGKDF